MKVYERTEEVGPRSVPSRSRKSPLNIRIVNKHTWRRAPTGPRARPSVLKKFTLSKVFALMDNQPSCSCQGRVIHSQAPTEIECVVCWYDIPQPYARQKALKKTSHHQSQRDIISVICVMLNTFWPYTFSR